MMKRVIFFWLWPLVFFMFSCEEKESPPAKTSEVRIIEFQFVLPDSDTGSKLLAQTEWIHPLEESIDLVFVSFEDGSRYSISIDPNNLEQAPELFLPFGSYELTGRSTITETANYLPFRVSQEVQISGATTDLSIQGQTTFGLFIVETNRLREAPRLMITNQPLSEGQGFYFVYGNIESTVSIELAPKIGDVYFRNSWKPSALSHLHFALDFPENEDQSTFITPSFSESISRTRINSEGYPESLTPLDLTDLAADQKENSGLAYFRNRLFSVNDGGNSSEIFELDLVSGEVIKRVEIGNASNIDWEDLAQSETHLYIGDFGNNNGNRNDLRVLKIAWEDILSQNSLNAEFINFSYEDQTDFSGVDSDHNFDSEAFFYSEGQLHLFTKNRGDLKTNHYRLPSNPGTYSAMKVNEFDTKGLISAADFNADTQTMILLGYRLEGLTSSSFIWLFQNFTGDNYLSGASHRINLGSPIILGQTEGVSFETSQTVLISAEGFTSGPFEVTQNIKKVDLTGIL